MGTVVATLVGVAVVGCAGASYTENLPCSASGHCPPRQQCGGDNVCRSTANGVDAASGTGDAATDAPDRGPCSLASAEFVGHGNVLGDGRPETVIVMPEPGGVWLEIWSMEGVLHYRGQLHNKQGRPVYGAGAVQHYFLGHFIETGRLQLIANYGAAWRDLWDLADLVPESLAALLRSARLGKPTPVEDAFGPVTA